jgi:hypothetical protein
VRARLQIGHWPEGRLRASIDLVQVNCQNVTLCIRRGHAVRRRRPSAARILPDKSQPFKFLHLVGQESQLRRATSSHLGTLRWHLLLRQYLHKLVVYGRVCSEPGPKHIGMRGNNPPQFRLLFGRQPVLHRSLQHLVALDLRLCSPLVADFDVAIVIDRIFVRRVPVTFRVLEGRGLVLLVRLKGGQLIVGIAKPGKRVFQSSSAIVTLGDFGPNSLSDSSGD